jgi:hypothetical protein
MKRPKKPEELSRPERIQPANEGRRRSEETSRTIPGRRNIEPERKRGKIVNEDEQLKDVNQREVNAQSNDYPESSQREAPSGEDVRLEAPDDNSEVNPRPRKVI